MTTVAVIGSDGKSGQQFVSAALARGWRVRGGVRNPSTTTLKPQDNLEIIKCDALVPADVEHLLDRADVVVSLIGHGLHSPPTLQADAIQNVLDVMQARGLRRIISLTGTGVRSDGDRIPFNDYLLNIPLRLILGSMVADGIAHAERLKRSNADWTIVRALKLTNSNDLSPSLSPHGPPALFVSRKAVAANIIDCIEQNTYVREMPIFCA